MASVGVLPPIKKERLAPDHPPKTSSIGNEVMPPITQTVQLSFSKKGTHEERVRRRLKKLRQQLPLLAKVETYRIQNTFKHNLCLDILQGGYHESFSQIFNLMQLQQLVRLQAGPESVLWTKKLLHDEPEKLTVMKEWLTRAEDMELEEDFESVYQCYHELAKYFQTTCNEDKWISDTFFDLALDATAKLKDSDGRLMAEAHCNVDLHSRKIGSYLEATDHFEVFYQLTEDKPEWVGDTGDTLRTEACRQLCLIYSVTATKLGTNPHQRDQHLEYLQKAYDMANEGGGVHLEGVASYKLGLAYEKSRESEAAFKYLTVYKDACMITNDDKGLGKAYQAMAKSLQSLGKEDESIKHLEMFAEVSEQSHDDRALSEACSSLGEVFNSLGEYDQAVDNFTKAYNISRALNDDATISVARMLYGIATAHKMTSVYMRHIDCVEEKGFMGRLMEWKDARTEEIANSCIECEKVEYEADKVTDAQIRQQSRERQDTDTKEAEAEEANEDDKGSKDAEDSTESEEDASKDVEESKGATEDN
ncbi:hypothetical protein NP493_112g01025 [Ridgeia piscesae]|uniref:Tetratricopeptide repeat protein 29 n=1 Tax=Ridgeia piscesae TaxID=27915 RepID=A0AAD9P6T7_RIDPI|nr:hypothetical protein NP493_112g01025 [Ridgeia piscesae]